MLELFKGVSSGIQVDIVDGVFVPHTSWPFTELDVEESMSLLKPYAQDFEIEVDCMCMHPELYLELFQEIGVKRVIVHEGTTDKYDVCIREAKMRGYKVGLGILNSTPKDFLASYADVIDFVQVMGIAHIGIQGQPFDTQTLDTVAYIHLTYPHLEIAVDGAVNRDTILKLKAVGVTRFAPGSAVVKSSDPVLSYKQLQSQIGA
jgi:pentose-5-phosphate-3-epimerase